MIYFCLSSHNDCLYVSLLCRGLANSSVRLDKRARNALSGIGRGRS